VHAWPRPQIPVLPDADGVMPSLVDSSTGERVQPVPGDSAGLYVCGITPYDATHIGHAATYVSFDLLVRAWLDAGRTVTYVSNVTDVDDPLLERANATGVDWLGVVPPDVYLGAVETVPQVVDAVERLVAAGAAYRVPNEPGAGGDQPDLGDVYADVSVDPSFGDVARLDRDEMTALFRERGGDPERVGKRDPLDPLLWRRERPGEPAWDGGSLGTGRPGWHVECAVIARQGLGSGFHVQGGGADLLFPHHEMSTSHLRLLADGERATAHLHVGLVSYQGEKMSKSRGNLVLVSRLLEQGVDPMAIRLALLDHHYRSEWEWFDDDLVRAQMRLARWREAVSGNGGPEAATTLAAMRAALRDDLDAPTALRAVDAWAERAVTESSRDDVVVHEGAPGVIARGVNALLGVRI
jgi:L-cysteine:1D-myo-inositol 2-amino-2-deoxy-alpha-D-glucopyranoside ligase